MGYIYDFDVGSIAFFSLTLLFYFSQKRLRDLQDKIFSAMLIFAMLAICFDFAAVAMEYSAIRYPVWLLYAANILFMLGIQSCLPLFFLYSMTAAGLWGRLTLLRKLATALPYIVTMTLLLLSPLTDFGIFSISAEHLYQIGPTHSMLYVNMGIYVLSGVMVLLRNARIIQPLRRNVILLFVGLLFTAMLLQLLFPRYMLMPSATALALTSVFYALQSPADQIDHLTGAFSRTLLPSLLQSFIGQGRAYTLLLFSLRSFEEITRLYGGEAGGALLRAGSERLTSSFPDGVVVYMDTSDFIVVRKGILPPEEAERIHGMLPETMVVPGYGPMRPEICFGVAPYTAGESVNDALTTADYMLREFYTMEYDSVFYADEAYKRDCLLKLELEASLDRLLRPENAVILRRPISAPNGVMTAEEVILGVPGEAARCVTPRQFLLAASRSSHAHAYYTTLLTALRDRRDLYSAQRPLCIPMLPAAFLREDMPEQMRDLTLALGFRPEQLLLALGEAEIASGTSTLTKNIRTLDKLGFAIMVDSFAEGYTDMSLMISLPLRYARLHESFTRSAADSAEGAKLLRGLIGILTKLGVKAICTGIDTPAQRQAVLDAGGTLLQGACACEAAPTGA